MRIPSTLAPRPISPVRPPRPAAPKPNPEAFHTFLSRRCAGDPTAQKEDPRSPAPSAAKRATQDETAPCPTATGALDLGSADASLERSPMPAANAPAGMGRASAGLPTLVPEDDSAWHVRAKLELGAGAHVHIAVRRGREITLETDDENLHPVLARVRQKLRRKGYDCGGPEGECTRD